MLSREENGEGDDLENETDEKKRKFVLNTGSGLGTW